MSLIGQEGEAKFLGDFTDEDKRLAEKVGTWLMQNATGEGAFSAKICIEFGINGRKLRKLISYLRWSNRVKFIVSTTKGYKVTTDEAEVRDFIEYMQARAAATAAVANVMRKAIGMQNPPKDLFENLT